MATSRTYDDMCGMAHALDLVGERWALLVLRELVLGPRRFTDLHRTLPGISTNVLSRRLDELARAGVVLRGTLPPPAASAVYELTEWGKDLEPIMKQLGRWGARSPQRPLQANLSASSLILSLRTNFDPAAAGDLHATYELHLDSERFLATIAGETLQTGRSSGDADADTVLECAPEAMAWSLYGGRPLREAIAASDIMVQGDLTAAERFLGAFTLPEPVASC